MANPTISILPFNVWRTTSASTRKPKQGAYDPAIETPPDLPWFRFNKALADAGVDAIYHDVIAIIDLSARPQDVELAELKNSAKTVKQVFFGTAKTVGIVGQQAMGKSLLINALLHRRRLSKTSAAGGACTASAIKYVFKSGADDVCEIYDAAVQFMDDDELKEIIAEHGRRYHHFHYSEAVDPSWQEEEERAARTAEAFFALLWDAGNDELAGVELRRLLSAQCIDSGELQDKAMDMAKRRIEDSGADTNRRKEFLGLEAAALLDKTQSYIAQDDTQPSLWPIVSYVSIALGSILSRNGVYVDDYPGLGDENQSRTAATYANRRKADVEIIVAKSDRVRTEEVVDAQIKYSIRAHGAKNTILVLTKIDEYFQDNHSIENIIETGTDAPFPAIKEAMAATERAQVEAEEQQSGKMDFDNDDAEYKEETEFATYMDALGGYQEYLKETAQCAFVQQRAAMLESQMRFKYIEEDPDPIHVFSVSSSQYMDWMKKRRHNEPLLSPEMTGIPKLRQFLLGISAADNLDTYRRHINTLLPDFLSRIERVVNNENKDDAYAEIRPCFNELVRRLKASHGTRFETWLNKKLLRIWTVPGNRKRADEKVADVVQEWGEGTKYNTYNKFLRERGIFKGSRSQKYKGGVGNWNEEVSDKIRSEFLAWRSHMMKEVEVLAKQLHAAVKAKCGEVTVFLENSSLPDALKAIALEDWRKRRSKILQKSGSLDGHLKKALIEIYKYATTETDTRCMIAKVNAMVYTTIQKMPYTESWFIRQKAAMNEAMFPSQNGKNLLDWIAEHHFTTAKSTLQDYFTTFLLELESELQTFDDHMGERLPSEYELTEGDHQIRDELRHLLPFLEQRVAALADLLPPEEDKAQVKQELEEDGVEADGEATPERPWFRCFS